MKKLMTMMFMVASMVATADVFEIETDFTCNRCGNSYGDGSMVYTENGLIHQLEAVDFFGMKRLTFRKFKKDKSIYQEMYVIVNNTKEVGMDRINYVPSDDGEGFYDDILLESREGVNYSDAINKFRLDEQKIELARRSCEREKCKKKGWF